MFCLLGYDFDERLSQGMTGAGWLMKQDQRHDFIAFGFTVHLGLEWGKEGWVGGGATASGETGRSLLSLRGAMPGSVPAGQSAIASCLLSPAGFPGSPPRSPPRRAATLGTGGMCAVPSSPTQAVNLVLVINP